MQPIWYSNNVNSRAKYGCQNVYYLLSKHLSQFWLVLSLYVVYSLLKSIKYLFSRATGLNKSSWKTYCDIIQDIFFQFVWRLQFTFTLLVFIPTKLLNLIEVLFELTINTFERGQNYFEVYQLRNEVFSKQRPWVKIFEELTQEVTLRLIDYSVIQNSGS